MPLLVLGGALLAAYALFSQERSAPSSASKATSSGLPPTAIGTVGATAPNGFMLIAPTSAADVARLVALVGPLPSSAQGLKDIVLLADPTGSFVAAFFGTATPKGLDVRDIRLLKGATLPAILQNPAVRDAVLYWENRGALAFFEKDGHRVSLRALFGLG